MKKLKAEPKKHRYEYEHKHGQACITETNRDGKACTSLFKFRSIGVIFRNRRLPKSQLQAQCKAHNITFRRAAVDMPVRWNSSSKFVKEILRQKDPIRAVLAVQDWDESVREHLTPTKEDWDILEEIHDFFEVFYKPTTTSQADKYPTLHRVLPEYISIMRQLNVWRHESVRPILQAAAEAAWKVMDEYFKKTMKGQHSYLATMCDPRYKLQIFSWLYENDGGKNHPHVELGRRHFRQVYTKYKDREAKLREWRQQQAKNSRPDEESDVEEEEEDPSAWRDAFYGFSTASQATSATGPTSNLSVTIGELDRWLADALLPTKSGKSDNEIESIVTMFWRSKEFDYPIVAQMARDFLAIPATSAASERVFSQGGDLITKKRNRIGSNNVRYVLCLRAWSCLEEDDNDDEEERDE
jgi:hypothetical protein